MLCSDLCTLGDMEFSERLRAAMALRSVAPKQLADTLGVSVQAVGQVLSGSTRALTAANTVRAARFLGVSVYWLATGEGEMRTPEKNGEQMALTQQERDLIVALRVLHPDDRAKVIESVLDKARDHVKQLEDVIARNRAPAQLVPLPRKR